MSKPNVEDIYQLSPGQQGMLTVVLLSGAQSEVYFDQSTMTLGGELEVGLWRRAWQRVLDRHPSLRTLFVWERRGEPLQVVRREVEIPWQELDWSGLPLAEREARLESFLREDRARGFDLGVPPLMRLALIRWEEATWKMVWSFHHLIVDGWSVSRVLGEAVACYAAFREGREPDLEPPRRFRDYIAWLQGQDLGRAEAFWRGVLAGFEEPTPLPYDGTGRGDSSAADRELLWLPPAEAEALSTLARRHQLTLNTLFQGAWGALLARATGRDDVLFGSVVSGRPGELEGIESVVGFFINVLPVRMRIGGEAVGQALAHLQADQVEQREFEYVPLESIQAWLGLPRGSRLMDSLLVFQNFPLNPVEPAASPGFRFLESQGRGVSHYPVTLYVAPRAGGLDLSLNYHENRLDAAAARRLLHHLRTLLAAFVAHPEARLAELPLIPAAERLGLLAAALGAPVAPADRCIHTLLEQQAARTPDAHAVEAGGRALTYRELNERAEILAHRLRRRGVGPESIVGLCAERSPEMVVGLLAVLKAGGVYLPLDPAYPRERLAFMMEDSGARVLLTQASLAASLPVEGREVVLLEGAEPGDGAEPAAGPRPVPANGAYVIYTSGSTGRPKGVLVPHASLVSYVRGAAEEAGIGAGDRILQFASLSFDTSAEEIFPCLTRGATLVLRDDEMVSSLAGFLHALERLKVTVLDLPTAYWHELVAEMAAQDLPWPACVRLVILGGEQAQAARLDVWRQRVDGRCRLLNTYGPTEATIVSTRRPLDGPRDFPAEVPIGRPVPGARVHVVSRDLEPMPPGLDGELVIGGNGLARGYLGRPDLTAERFVPDPAAASPGERLYRTGDLARRLPNGELEFRGRTDQQVKVRGFRIELGEIETALRRLAGVRDAAAVVREDTPGERRIAAYVVPADGAVPSTTELRAGLRELLPEHMLPAIFQSLAALPLTPSGKVDRRALGKLPAAEARPDLEVEFAAPRNQVEEMLCGLWSDLLGVERVGIHDDFFQLGGHSLLVAKLAARVRQTFGAELPILEVFKTPTVAALAAAIERAERVEAAAELPPIRRAPRDRPIPLSFPQERVWFLDQLSAGNNLAYNFQVTLWFRGALDAAALHRALSELVHRHEVLRTAFPTLDGRPVQVVQPARPVALPVIDLRGVPEAERPALSERLVAELLQIPFDITRPPLIRWTLLKVADDFHELVQVEYHFVHDGWSFAVMLRELRALYVAFAAGEPSPLPELPVQYADFAAWQRSWMEGEAMGPMLDYWRRKLAGSLTDLELPTDRPRPVQSSFAGELRLLRLPPELYRELRDFSRRQGFTLFMTMLAGFYTLLYRYTGQEDILLGTTNANRRMREIEGMVGMVVNSLVLRGDLAGDPTFSELLARVREMTIEAQVYQDMPLERIVQELRPERQLSRNPLFQVMFHFHDAEVPDFDFPGLETGFAVRGNRTAKMDLNVIISPRAEQRVGLASAAAEDLRAVVHWEYNTDLFDAVTMERMIACYFNLLAAAARNPGLRLSELPLLTPEEAAAVVAAGNDTAAEVALRLVQQLVERSAATRPHDVAVSCAGTTLTYADLNAQANRLAHRLRRLGAGPESRVAVCLERSPDLVTALLGVLKSGAAYVPLDPGYPADRLAWVLADSRAAVLLTQSSLLGALPVHEARALALDEVDLAGESAADPAPWAEPDSPAYVIYTSGSTGRPKGVVVRQRSVVNLLASMARRPGLGPQDVLLAVTTISFDIAGLELFLPLTVGGRVELVERETAVDGRRLAARLASCGATVMQATPATWRLLLESGWPGSRGLKVLCGGEALPPDLAREMLGRVGSLWNVYGPTETTIWSTVHEVSAGDADSGRPVPLGGPIANTEAYLLDRLERGLPPMPDGVPGELYIGGEGLARGYFGRPDLTAERFLPDPFSGRPGARLYRTGDLVRRRPRDGALEFLGRADFQVKIRGFRIELGEVEAVLAQFPGVRQCVATVREDRPGDRRLVAYLVSANGALRTRELRDFLAQRLPEYMVPTDFVALEGLPLSPAGKVDRGALPSPDPARREEEVEHVAPRDAVEETLAAIWSEVLDAERVGVRDDFFALGGHSLSAARVLARVRDLLRVELPLSAVFERRTIERMARLIAEQPAAPALELAPALAEAEMDGLLAHAAALSDADLDALLDDMMAAENP
jgi:amino acid adenylation domain-containing protein